MDLRTQWQEIDMLVPQKIFKSKTIDYNIINLAQSKEKRSGGEKVKSNLLVELSLMK